MWASLGVAWPYMPRPNKYCMRSYASVQLRLLSILETVLDHNSPVVAQQSSKQAGMISIMKQSFGMHNICIDRKVFELRVMKKKKKDEQN